MKSILFIVLLIFGIIFAMQNETEVTIKYFHFTLENVRLYNVILATILIGFIGGVIHGYIESLGIKRELKKEKKVRKGLEKEIEKLRILPLAIDSEFNEDDDKETETETEMEIEAEQEEQEEITKDID